MAATNGVIEGGVMVMYVGALKVAFSDNVSYSVNPSLREIKNKDTGRWPQRKLGSLDASGSCSVMYAELDDAGSAIYNLSEVFTAILAGTEVTLKITNDNTGDYEWSGPAQFSALNLEMGMYGENAKGDFSFQASGEWSYGVIT